MTTDTIKVKVFVLLKHSMDSIRGGRAPYYSVQEGDASAFYEDPNWLFVHESTIDVQRPTIEHACDQAVKAFQEEKRRLQAETGKRITEIDAEIGKLLAISQ